MEHKLAIIIPAYKDVFLDKTLDSLSKQTCSDFTVYIGDDCSPYGLFAIVERYLDILNIVYHKFDENIGGKSLIGQWARCLGMIGQEEYFCLFSDDDLMSAKCVEKFYYSLEHNPAFDVYHFNIDIIDRVGTLIRECPLYPPVISSSDFFSLLYSYQIDARMPEFIFRTEHFFVQGGFVDFDLAYRSDNAIVMQAAAARGICTVQDAKVKWRDSGLNISSTPDVGIVKRKAMATIDFFNWIQSFYRKLDEPSPLSFKNRFRLVSVELLSLKFASNKELYSMFKKMNIEGGGWTNIRYRLRFIMRLCKRNKK